MISRCKYCNAICPDFSSVCDTCFHIEFECDMEIFDLDEEIEDEGI